MTVGSAPRPRTFGRLLLLAVLLGGVAAMHTLGHPTAGAHATCQDATAAIATTASAGHRHALAAGVSAMFTSATHHTPAHAGGLGACTDPASVCLAVLPVSLLAWLLALVGARPGRLMQASAGAGPPSCRRGRGPPDPASPVQSLLLARVSVLRI